MFLYRERKKMGIGENGESRQKTAKKLRNPKTARFIYSCFYTILSHNSNN